MVLNNFDVDLICIHNSNIKIEGNVDKSIIVNRYIHFRAVLGDAHMLF